MISSILLKFQTKKARPHSNAFKLRQKHSNLNFECDDTNIWIRWENIRLFERKTIRLFQYVFFVCLQQIVSNIKMNISIHSLLLYLNSMLISRLKDFGVKLLPILVLSHLLCCEISVSATSTQCHTDSNRFCCYYRCCYCCCRARLVRTQTNYWFILLCVIFRACSTAFAIHFTIQKI